MLDITFNQQNLGRQAKYGKNYWKRKRKENFGRYVSS